MISNTSGLAASYHRLWIPPIFYRQPLLSRLVSRFDLPVNIQSALLEGSDHQGCFDVLLHGHSENLAVGLAYLKDLSVKIFELKPAGLKVPNIQVLGLPVRVSHSRCKPSTHRGIAKNQPELCQLRCFHLEVRVRGAAASFTEQSGCQLWFNSDNHQRIPRS